MSTRSNGPCGVRAGLDAEQINDSLDDRIDETQSWK